MALQTTSGSLREKWVAAFLPTAAIILVAFLYFNFSLNPEMGEVEKEYKAAKAASVSQADIDMRQSQSEELRNEVDELEKAKKSFETEMEEKKKEFTQRKPTEKHSAVTELFQKYDVAVIQDQLVDEISLPTVSNESIENLKTLQGFQELIHFRELTLMANYTAIVELLNEVPKIPGVIPVRVALDKTNQAESAKESEGPTLKWIVTLLM